MCESERRDARARVEAVKGGKEAEEIVAGKPRCVVCLAFRDLQPGCGKAGL